MNCLKHKSLFTWTLYVNCGMTLETMKKLACMLTPKLSPYHWNCPLSLTFYLPSQIKEFQPFSSLTFLWHLILFIDHTLLKFFSPFLFRCHLFLVLLLLLRLLIFSLFHRVPHCTLWILAFPRNLSLLHIFLYLSTQLSSACYMCK